MLISYFFSLYKIYKIKKKKKNFFRKVFGTFDSRFCYFILFLYVSSSPWIALCKYTAHATNRKQENNWSLLIKPFFLCVLCMYVFVNVFFFFFSFGSLNGKPLNCNLKEWKKSTLKFLFRYLYWFVTRFQFGTILKHYFLILLFPHFFFYYFVCHFQIAIMQIINNNKNRFHFILSFYSNGDGI